MSAENFLTDEIDTLYSRLKSSTNGLSVSQAETLLLSQAPKKKRSEESDIFLFLEQFKSPISILLLIAAVLSLFLGEKIDSILILSIVFISGGLSFWQEHGARNAVKAMLQMVQIKCNVLRGGNAVDVAANAIVPGDIVLFTAGDTIPADCRIVESKEIFVDESALTGETFPVEKHAGTLAFDTPLSQRNNALFAGTHVISGTAKAICVLVGDNTELGKVTERLASKPPETNFEHSIAQFGYFLMKVTLVLVIVILVMNLFHNRPILESFMFSLAIAVGLTPQLLPAIISINLATGAKQMADSKVIVKRLASIESFGSMNVLCSDKTGTLTEGTVELAGIIDTDGKDSAEVKLLAYLNATMETGFTNPIDTAIKKLEGIDASQFEKLDEIPYDFIRKRLTILVSNKEKNSNTMIVKGAFKNVFSVCTKARSSSKDISLDEVRSKIEAEIEKLSAEGKRVLGIAIKDTNDSKINIKSECDMTFVGLLVFFDPPKAGIAKTIEELKKLGVTLKIISGDNHLVAKALAMQIGFANPTVLSYDDFKHLNEEELAKLANSTDVFAEVEPNEKEKIILALKKAGNVVGYVGDGINDAPALHAADVGISVNNAVDVAKDAAQLIMLEHDLQVLVTGIKEGRKTFANTMKYIFMATSANFGNMFSMAGASLILPFLPLLPHQILLNNLMTDLPEMTIATDNVDDEMVQNPMQMDIKFIRSFMIVFGCLSSLFDFITFYLLYFVMKADPSTFRSGWFLESICSAAIIVLVIRTRRTISGSRPSIYLLGATITVIGCSIAIPYTAFGKVIGFSPLHPNFVLAMAVIVCVYIIAAELCKRFFYKFYNKASARV